MIVCRYPYLYEKLNSQNEGEIIVKYEFFFFFNLKLFVIINNDRLLS